MQGVHGGTSVDEARTTLRSRFTPELAEKILTAKVGQYVETVAYEWGESEGPQQASPGIFCI
jgi:hypothetical protein